MPASGNRAFRVGQVLWKDVMSDGNLDVLGSDGAYYPSAITFEGSDRLHIDVDRANSPGNDQTWERAGPSVDGIWVFQTGTEPANVGLQVQVEGYEGRVRFLPATVTGRLRVGNALWRTIRGGGRMEAQVGGSYRPARLVLLDEDRLRVEIDTPSGTVEEAWVRQGSDAERIGETEKNLLPDLRARARETLGAALAERSIPSLLAAAADSIASPSWGTIDLGGESVRVLVLGCQVGNGPDDALFVRGAGEAADGRPVEVELERSMPDGGVLERASILLGDRFDGELWTASARSGGGQRAGDAPEQSADGGSLFVIDGERVRVEGRFRSTGAGAREGVVEVSCGG
jgi:hypothetical protein